MEESSKQTKQQMIASGLCPSGHDTQDKVCKECYMELLKKFNNLSTKKDKIKSPWHTW